jgi:hypothetical protein
VFTRSAVIIAAILFACVSFAFAQSVDISASVDADREVIVLFTENVVTPPAGKSSGMVNEFRISSQPLEKILQESSVEAISRVIADFKPEDRFAVSRTGEQVTLTDWSNIYVLRLPSLDGRQALLDSLKKRPEIVYAEPHGYGQIDTIDEYFYRQWALKNDGTTEQGSGIPGADIKATEAWDITTGSSSIKIGIVGEGMQTNHPDFTGRVTGDAGDNSGHGTAIAGIAAAKANNSIGIAGVAWNVGIINEDFGAASDADFAAAVLSASNRGAHVINNSWHIGPVGRYSETVRLAFSDVYKLNRVAVAAMGNQYGEVIQYPAASYINQIHESCCSEFGAVPPYGLSTRQTKHTCLQKTPQLCS